MELFLKLTFIHFSDQRIDLGEFGKRSNHFPVCDHSRTFSLFYVLIFLGES